LGFCFEEGYTFPQVSGFAYQEAIIKIPHIPQELGLCGDGFHHVVDPKGEADRSQGTALLGAIGGQEHPSFTEEGGWGAVGKKEVVVEGW
jgi:hypothetical protein